MPAMAIEDIRRKLVTDTRPAVLARLREKAVQAGDDPDAVVAKFVTSDQTVAEGSREVVGAVSAETVDEDGDVILLKGWDLSYFRKHPVVMGFHDYGKYPTGKCLWIKPDKGTGRLLTKTQYATRPESWPREQEWPPDTILELRQQDVMRGYSVGFVLLEDREPTAKEVKDHPEWEGRRIIARAKLLEYSDVPLPCNADAAQIMVAKGLLPKQEADDDGADGDAATPAADAGDVDGQRSVPADPDADTPGDADVADPESGGVVDAGGAGERVLATAVVAGADGVEAKEVAPEPPPGPTPAEVAHLRVLREIWAGKYVNIDEEAIERAALEKAVARQMAYHKGHLG